MLFIDTDIFEWINTHRHINTDRLLLRYGNNPRLKFAIQQIICRKKAAKKLASTLENDLFIFPTTLSAEQCTSDAAAAYHASLIPERATAIDLTCGLGIDAFTIARKSTSVTAFELQESLVEAARHNAHILGIDNFQIINADCVSAISTTALKADAVFIDPARRDNTGKRVFGLQDCSPDVTTILPQLLDIAPKVIIKASPMLDIAHTLSTLSNIECITALGTTTECKELIIICTRGHISHCIFKAVTLMGNNQIKECLIDTTTMTEPTYGIPTKSQYLFEPYPAVMKLSHYANLTALYNVTKCDRDSHLYFSDYETPDFPGHRFKILDILPFNKQSLRDIQKRYDRLDVTCRNFPLSAPELTTRLKVMSDSSTRLFATTCCGQRMLIISASCEP